MKLKVFLVLFLSFTGSLFSQDVKVLLQKGNEAYQEKNYEEAIGNYEQVLDMDFESPGLYYNLGNSYFRMNEIGRAILNYERSLKLEPTYDDAQYNLLIAKARTVDKIQDVPKLFFVQWWINIVTSLSVSEWAKAALLVYLILLVIIGVFFLVRKRNVQKISFYSGSVILVFLVLSLIFLFARINYDASNDYGVLLASVESAKISPDENSSDVFVIHEGIKFEIEDNLSAWTKIKLPDGKVGWLPKDSFERI